MALWKPFRGNRTSLETVEKHDGYAYFCTDDGSLFFDYVDLNGNLQRKQISAKDAETIMGKSLAELQADWSVNDETNPAYIKNRPFYTTDAEIIELHNGTAAFQEFTQKDVTFYVGAPEKVTEYDNFMLGQDIKIIFDDVEYNLKLRESEMGTLYAGNGSIINDLYGINDEDTGEPFLYMPGDGFITFLSDAEHTVLVHLYVVEDITIPHKYLGLDIWNGDGNKSIVLGNKNNIASGTSAFASGTGTTSSGDNSHAEGDMTTASGPAAHSEGQETTASRAGSHAEGYLTVASNARAHAEGMETVASGMESHAEGQGTKAEAVAAHAEGINTTASGDFASHAEGYYAKATADYAHAEGFYTVAASQSQHVQGKYNVEDGAAKYAHIVGNGENTSKRSNAHTLDWSGNAWFSGDVKVGGTGQDDANAKTLATTEYVDSKAGGWETLMDVTLDEECVDVIGITLTAEQKEKIANGSEFVCYAQCPPPSEYESKGWIEGGLWADDMYYFMLSTGKPSGIVPSATENYTLKFYFNLKNASGDTRIRDMFYNTNSNFQVYEFIDTTTFMNNYQTQSLTVRFKTSGMFAVGTRLICKVR